MDRNGSDCVTDDRARSKRNMLSVDSTPASVRWRFLCDIEQNSGTRVRRQIHWGKRMGVNSRCWKRRTLDEQLSLEAFENTDPGNFTSHNAMSSILPELV
jgi:hypothetical protein